MESQGNLNLQLRDSCLKGDLQGVKTLLDSGADPSYIFDEMEGSALHIAVSYDTDETDILEEILSSGKINDVDVRTPERLVTPLHVACYLGNVKCARMLISYGADIKATSKAGSSVVHLSAGGGSVAMVKECLKWEGVNVNKRQKKNKGTPLMYACEGGHVDCAKFLVSIGADTTTLSSKRMTVIYNCVYSNSVTMVTECLKWSGVNINDQSWYGTTPLMFACELGHREIAELLLASGADVNLKDAFINGRRALWYARENEEIKAILLNHPGIIVEKKSSGTVFQGLRNFMSRMLPINVSSETGQIPSSSHRNSQKLSSEELANFIKKVLPDFPDDAKLQSVLSVIEKCGINLSNLNPATFTFTERNRFN